MWQYFHSHIYRVVTGNKSAYTFLGWRQESVKMAIDTQPLNEEGVLM